MRYVSRDFLDALLAEHCHCNWCDAPLKGIKKKQVITNEDQSQMVIALGWCQKCGLTDSKPIRP